MSTPNENTYSENILDTLRKWAQPIVLGGLMFFLNNWFTDLQDTLKDINTKLSIIDSRSSKNSVEVDLLKMQVQRIEQRVYEFQNAHERTASIESRSPSQKNSGSGTPQIALLNPLIIRKEDDRENPPISL